MFTAVLRLSRKTAINFNKLAYVKKFGLGSIGTRSISNNTTESMDYNLYAWSQLASTTKSAAKCSTHCFRVTRNCGTPWSGN